MASLIFATIIRDTRNDMPHADLQENFYPASPLCSVNWIDTGEVRMEGDVLPLPRLTFSGPQTKPSRSFSSSPVYATMVAFYPDTWTTLTGRDVTSHVDQIVPLDDALPADLMPAFVNPFDFRLLQERLAPIWAARRPYSTFAPAGILDWINAFSAQARQSGIGTGLRQLQRRIKAGSGQSQRQLELYRRAQVLFEKSQDAASLSGLALEAGYADQSHMGREVRTMTGFSPKHINAMIAEDERFWFYRLLRETL